MPFKSLSDLQALENGLVKEAYLASAVVQPAPGAVVTNSRLVHGHDCGMLVCRGGSAVLLRRYVLFALNCLPSTDGGGSAMLLRSDVRGNAKVRRLLSLSLPLPLSLSPCFSLFAL